MKTNPASEKILISLGSGIGSLGVAWLLKKQGHQLRGVYFDFAQDPIRTQWVQQIEKKLGIPIQIIDVTPELETKVVLPWLEYKKHGVEVSMRKLFQQNIMFPKLFELKKSHHFDKIATGHFAITQFDEHDKVMRIKRSIEAERDEAAFLLSLTQEEIRDLVLPLGSIPSSMGERIAGELSIETIPALRLDPTWDRLKSFALKTFKDNGEREYEVYNMAGEKVGTAAHGLMYAVGEQWKGFENDPLHPEEAKEKYFVFGVDPLKGQMQVGTLTQRVIKQITLHNLSWLVPHNLKLKGLSCSMIWNNPLNAVPVKILEYEGNRARAYLETPLQKTEADIFAGQTVLWVAGDEIIGGAEVASCE